MTSISSLGVPPTSPLYQQASLPRAPYIDERVYDPVLDPANQAGVHTDVVVSSAQKSANSADNEPFSFWDFLDVINPLQHIPGINTIYRELTGDTIKTPIKLIGATVLGGPIGFAAAMADSMIAQSTGKDVGQHAMALLKNDTPLPPAAPENETRLAQALAPTSARAAAKYAAAQSYAPPAVQTAQEFVPDPVLAQAPTQKPAPSEAEAFVQAAQIAAQANVFPTFKRTGGLGTPTAADKAASQEKVLAAQASGQARFMPLQRDGAAPRAPNAARVDTATTSMSELKARSKFAPGPRGGGTAAVSPAALAAVTAAKTPAGESARLAAAQGAPTAQDTYNYGRQAANSEQPTATPVWFDQAMLGAIDKYKAMQNAQ